MSSSSLIMVHIASCLQELLLFVYENLPFETTSLSKSNSFDQNFMKLGHIVKYYNVFSKFHNGPYCTILFRSCGTFFMKFQIMKKRRARVINYFKFAGLIKTCKEGQTPIFKVGVCY